jgi:hypothetical protein
LCPAGLAGSGYKTKAELLAIVSSPTPTIGLKFKCCIAAAQELSTISEHRMDRRYSGLTKLGFGVLACNSALAVCKSWGDAGAVADAALVLLFA